MVFNLSDLFLTSFLSFLLLNTRLSTISGLERFLIPDLTSESVVCFGAIKLLPMFNFVREYSQPQLDEQPTNVKNLYDSFPTSKIFFSGSSTLALQKGKADLSRRAVFYTLPGLSFREYLYLAHRLEFESVSLQDIFESHSLLASTILEAGPVLGHFKDYLDHGVYPFFLEGIQVYFPKLLNVLEKVLYEDIPTTTGIKTANVPTLKRILWLIATSQPFIPNIERMSRNLKVSKEYVYTYLE